MQKFILIAICAVFALATKAQTNTEELRYLQSMFGMEKKQVVAERMKLSEAESAKFWSMYEEYELFGVKLLTGVLPTFSNMFKIIQISPRPKLMNL